MNKLAAIYNVFDSEELLQESINNIRSHVDLIIVIYQKISNFGINHSIDIEKYLKTIKDINIIELYDTNMSIAPWNNELIKRINGCRTALLNECTHFLYIDCDEMYEPQKFKDAKNVVYENNYDSSACSIVDFYKFKDLKINEENLSYVPFIHKLTKGLTQFGLDLQYPLLVDKTRKINPTNSFYLFSKNELVMNHYSWIRKDVRSKLLNSTARHSYNFFLEILVKEFENYKIGDKLIKLETGLIIPKNILSKVSIPYQYKDIIVTMDIK